METAVLGRRFFETTRGRIIALLRRGQRTVEELAAALGLTDNAVRSHLAALERDGLIRQEGVRRSGGAGKPAVLYDLHPDAAPLLSRAYPPVLTTMMEVLVAELPPDQADALIREMGRRLALGAGAPAPGALPARMQRAAAFLTAIGGDVDVVVVNGTPQIRGAGCPLSAVVRHRPEMCHAVETLVSEIVGAPAQTCCEHGERPRCCFSIGTAA